MENEIKHEDFVPVFVVGYLNDEKIPVGGRIACVPLKGTLEINSFTTAALLIALYGSCENVIPESCQNDFEKNTITIFQKMLEERHDYTSTHKFQDE